MIEVLSERQAGSSVCWQWWRDDARHFCMDGQEFDVDELAARVPGFNAGDTLEECGSLILMALAAQIPLKLELESRCGECGRVLTAVRPGKWQCEYCESQT